MTPPERRPARPARAETNRALSRLAPLAVLAVALLAGRGIFRASLDGLRDFAAPYAGTRLFWKGLDPYSGDLVAAELLRGGAKLVEHTPALYPPGAFLALTPFGLLPPETAKFAFLLLGLVLLFIGAIAWLRLCRPPRTTAAAVVLVFACSAPLHTALMVVNPALVAAGALLTGGAAWKHERRNLALVLLGWALLLKPQIGLLALPWLWLDGAKREALVLAAVGAAGNGLAALWISLRAPAAVASWQANFAAETATGSINASGPLSVHRIDPGALCAALLGVEPPLALMLALAVAIALFALRGDLRARPRPPADALRVLATGAACALWVGYHRAYDALILLPIWLLAASPQNWAARGRARRALLFVGIFWILPGGGFWMKVAQALPESFRPLSDSAFWSLGLQRGQSWLLVASILLLLCHRASATPAIRDGTAASSSAA